MVQHSGGRPHRAGLRLRRLSLEVASNESPLRSSEDHFVWVACSFFAIDRASDFTPNKLAGGLSERRRRFCIKRECGRTFPNHTQHPFVQEARSTAPRSEPRNHWKQSRAVTVLGASLYVRSQRGPPLFGKPETGISAIFCVARNTSGYSDCLDSRIVNRAQVDLGICQP